MKNTGLGLRREIADDLIGLSPQDRPAFVEIAPENWMNLGGYWKNKLRQASEKYDIFCHGLSLSIGSPDKLNVSFIKEVKKFLDEYDVKMYSEHLSYSKSDNAHLYDLLPIPFREDAITHIVKRIKQVQEILERPIALENVSYYTPVAAEMDEATFIRAIVEESGCKMLLDVNNIYVNSHNHNYDAREFYQNLPLNHVAYIHMAGHKKIREDLIIDTHGADIIDPVYSLFEWAIEYLPPTPVLLERDFNIPEMNHLLKEVRHLDQIAEKVWSSQKTPKKFKSLSDSTVGTGT
jgi:uncharacterized protein (UPF0276 family)